MQIPRNEGILNRVMATPRLARRLKVTLLDALGIRDLPFYLLNLKQLFVQSGIGQPIIYILLFSNRK